MPTAICEVVHQRHPGHGRFQPMTARVWRGGGYLRHNHSRHAVGRLRHTTQRTLIDGNDWAGGDGRQRGRPLCVAPAAYSLAMHYSASRFLFDIVPREARGRCFGVSSEAARASA